MPRCLIEDSLFLISPGKFSFLNIKNLNLEPNVGITSHPDMRKDPDVQTLSEGRGLNTCGGGANSMVTHKANTGWN